MGNLGESMESLAEFQAIFENIRELLGAIFIQEQRNYDMLVMIADNLGADTDKMISLHEQGSVLAPAPSFIFEDEENDVQSE
jgi:hypothetical protein